jgi:starch-binding outer membrane protein, SusD/RagB family
MKHNNFQKNRMAVRPVAVIITVAAIFMTGCKKFLDVPPKEKVPQATLFSDEQGFKEALIGVYLAMDKPTNGATNALYTHNLSMGMLSTLAYDYDNAPVANPSAGNGNSFFNNVVYYFYNEANAVRPEIDGIWGGMYSNIANLNNLLSQIDGKKSLFTADNFNRVKGEAVALRALFHFDLVRMFGQPPLTGAATKAIPYQTQFTVRSTPFSTLQAVLDSCITDLSAAKALLSATDTSSVLKAADDPFKSYTQNHLNYWAVQGLLARVYLYKGDLVNAEAAAKAVIGSGKFPLVSSNLAAATNPIRDRMFSQEHLFDVYSTNTKNYNTALFVSPTQPLRLLPAGKNAMYTTGSGSANDWRYTSWFDNNQGGINVPSKYFQDGNLPYELQNIVPVIRMPEMFYIAAECATTKGDINAGTSLLNKVRQARGLTALNATGISTTDSLSKEIMREYQKEFISEGQTFFYFKRLNKDLKQVTATTAANIPADVYVFPIPDREKEYNR